MANKNATQEFVPIRDIKDGVVILKNGQLCMTLLASSVNFALKSVEEQEAILRQFQAFLNTIDFSLQIYVQSRRLNIEPYLQKLAARENQQDNDLMRIQLREYMQFIRTFTQEVDVMSKSFFVTVSYSPIPIDLQANIGSFLNKKQSVPDPEERFAENRLQLEQRVTVVEQGLKRIGVRTAVLSTEELVELYYHIFNPIDVGNQAPTQQLAQAYGNT